jgi:hypothetical protein
MVLQIPKDDRDGRVGNVGPTDVSGQPEIPADRSGYHEEWDWSDISRRLKAIVEYTIVNVGGSCGEGCSPLMKRMSVGGVIVLGARESRVHGEGRQGIDVVLVQ